MFFIYFKNIEFKHFGINIMVRQDLKFFKNTTWAMPVIMGRKTFDALGKPLGGRTNIVITQNSGFVNPGVMVAGSLEEAIEKAKSLQTREIFIIGGGSVYEASLPMAHRVYLTRVHTRVEAADTWFPVLPEREWGLKWEQAFPADDKHAFDYAFQCWERKA